MRKKLDTRFPAARIKKIMQADEDVGKIALAVPVLVSKALELFLQDLCDRTYEITLQRGAKTMSSLHLKHCVQSYNVFDFLREVVSRVPDYGHAHPDAASEDRKKRKPTVEENNDSDDEFRKSKMQEMSHGGSSGRGRGRGRGRRRGRSSRNTERDTLHHEVESDPCTSLQHGENELNQIIDIDCGLKQGAKETIIAGDASDAAAPPSIDLNNTDMNVNEDSKATTAEAPARAPEPCEEPEHEEYPGWSLSGVDKMGIDPLQLVQLGKRLDEEEEDYDEEE